MKTFDEVRNLVKNNGYMFFESGDYNVNHIWIRTSENITNYFTDEYYALYFVGGKPQILALSCTTKPGIKCSIDSPITYKGVTGTAIIIPGQYRSSWKFIDGDYASVVNPINPFAIPYFKQIKGINYWRDGDKDLVIDEVQEQDNELFGTNWHAMSNKNVAGSPINNWSKGCMGWEWKNYVQVVDLMRVAVKKWGNVFTGTIIQE